MPDISTYTGSFGKNEINHLLKRTMFGAKLSDIEYFNGKSVQQVVDELLNPTNINTSSPIKDYNTNNVEVPDTNVIQGNTWINDIQEDNDINIKRIYSYKKWLIGKLLRQDRSIHEKISLFWLNHFGTNTESNSNVIYQHYKLLYDNALGNFKTMVDLVTKDVLMLHFLNGVYNDKDAPDENYARELQELFTIGKGLAENGYTEGDVQEAAKILTGWRINNQNLTSFFNKNRHDSSNKTFSTIYNNQIINGDSTINGGQNELDQLLNMIFAVDETAKHIVRKLYRWFVYYEITDAVENDVIIPLAIIFRTNNYEIKPVLKKLFESTHFYDIILSQGAIIKSPVDFFISSFREMELTLPDEQDWQTSYKLYKPLEEILYVSGQRIHDPDSVAGYQAYYQTPVFHEIWINSTTLPLRKQIVDFMLYEGITIGMDKFKFDILAYTDMLNNPSDPNELVTQLVEHFYRIEFSQIEKDKLKKEILLSGQASDYYWTIAWDNYKADTNNQANKDIVWYRLFLLFQQIMGLEEYQLS